MLKVDTIKLNKYAIDDCIVKVHINEVVQVLINIIKNARDIMVEKNDGMQKEQRELSIKYYKNEDFAIIEVEDNAGGIPQNIINRIFEPYFSTKKIKMVQD